MAVTYTPFLDLFPKIQYDINNNIYKTYENVGDVFFRIGVVRETIDKIGSYYLYTVRDGDTPEILAEKAYGDAGAGWMILYANYIFDPQFDWPLDERSFNNYIIGKYGSIENAKTSPHHYEKVVTRTDSLTGIVTEKRYNIDQFRWTVQEADVPYNYYRSYNYGKRGDSTITFADSTLARVDEDEINTAEHGALAFGNYFNTYNIGGKTVTEDIRGETIYCYDWENTQNENKRYIKIIKADYYDRIMNELKSLTGTYIPSFVRRLS